MPSTHERITRRRDLLTAHIPVLDQLRGLAVLAVVAFHSGILQGGFLGVDLFFALSGFLITRQIQMFIITGYKEGTLVREFWRRRVFRLLPALTIYIIASTIFIRFLENASAKALFRTQGFSALFYIANWVNIFQKVDYFAQLTTRSPFEHLWSLSIEEQIYAVWPIVFILAWYYSKNRHKTTRRILLTFSVATAVFSGVFMMISGARDQAPFAYFATLTRLGPTMGGICIALYIWRRKSGENRYSSAFANTVYFLIISIIFILISLSVSGSDSDLFAGRYQLIWLLIVGILALAILVFSSGLSGLLGKLLTFFGRVSYGLYLWHVLVLAGIERWVPSATGKHKFLLALTCSTGVAYLSTKFLEEPIRQRRGILTKVRGPLLIVLLISAAASLFSLPYTKTSADIIGQGWDPNKGIFVTPDTTSSTIPGTTTNSLPPETSPHRQPISRVMVFGDSVAFSLNDELETMAERTNTTLLNRAVIGCDLWTDYNDLKNATNGSTRAEPSDCLRWRKEWPNLIANEKPNYVVVLIGRPAGALRKIDGTWRDACSTEYKTAYRQQLDTAAQDIRNALNPVIGEGKEKRIGWTTVPLPEPDLQAGYEEVDCLNQVIEEFVHTQPDIELLDLNGFVCPQGSTVPCTAISPDGLKERTDGIHFDAKGPPWAGEFIYTQVIDESQ